MLSQMFFVDLFLMIVWVYLFCRERNTRQEMLVIGLAALLFSPLFIFLGQAQTSGGIDLTDLLFAFFLSGIAAVIFEAFFGQHYRTKHRLHLPFQHPGEGWFLRLALAVTLWAWLAILFLFLLHTTALQSLVTAGLVIGSYLLASRRDLFWNALWSALLMAIVFFLIYTLTFLLTLPNTTTTFFLNLPTDALLWAMTIGFVLGPMYEFVRDLKPRR